MSRRSEVSAGLKEKLCHPTFLRFKLANRNFNNSHVYKKCQIRLLEEEIKTKED